MKFWLNLYCKIHGLLANILYQLVYRRLTAVRLTFTEGVFLTGPAYFQYQNEKLAQPAKSRSFSFIISRKSTNSGWLQLLFDLGAEIEKSS